MNIHRIPFLMVYVFVFVLAAAVSLHPARAEENKKVRVLVWDEQQPEQKKAYGDLFLGETIAT